MKNEEEYVKTKMDGRKNPFRVPEDYFDSFADKLMEQLPEQQSVTKNTAERFYARVMPLRRWMYAAACLLVAVVSAVVWFSQKPVDTVEQPVHVASSVSTDSYLDEAADYAMVDNQDIYACLSSDNESL